MASPEQLHQTVWPRDQRTPGAVHEHEWLPGAGDVGPEPDTVGDLDHPLRHWSACRLRRSFSRPIASTSSSFDIRERPAMPSSVATPYRCALLALASTPPAVGASEPYRSCACSSDGPYSSFGRQLSPTFSCVCFSAAKATRCARSSSPSYCSIAASYACANVRCAFSSDRRRVTGSRSAGPPRTVWSSAWHLPVSDLHDRHPRTARPPVGIRSLVGAPPPRRMARTRHRETRSVT